MTLVSYFAEKDFQRGPSMETGTDQACLELSQKEDDISLLIESQNG